MSYIPSEDLNVSWPVRNDHWRLYKPEVRQRVSGIPHRYADLTVDSPLLDTENGEIVRGWVEAWPKRRKGGGWEDPERGKGLLLIGPPGRGKTTCGIAALNSVSEKGWASKYITVANWHEMALTAISLSRAHAEDEAEAYEDGLSAYGFWDAWPMLMLDDLGKEHRTASRYAEDNLDRLIRSRYDSGAPTILTSNFDVGRISKVYGESMGSFIHEAFMLVSFGSDVDHRVRRVSRAR